MLSENPLWRPKNAAWTKAADLPVVAFSSVWPVEKARPHSEWGSLFGAPPCSPAHLPDRLHHGLPNVGRDVNNESWSRNHSWEHKGAGEGRRRPQPALLQVGSFDSALMEVWWVHMGQHGFLCTCLQNICGVYAQPTNPFCLFSEGGFSCGTLLRNKQLKVPKQPTAVGDMFCAMCVPRSSRLERFDYF